MANECENTEIPTDFTATKAALFDRFNKLKKWREEQVQQFRCRQLQEHQQLLHQNEDSQNKIDAIILNAVRSPSPGKSDYVPLDSSSPMSQKFASEASSNDTVQNSSMTNHLLRCFDDSQTSISNKTDQALLMNPIFNGKAFINFEKQVNLANNSEETTETQTKKAVGKRPFLKKGTGLLRYMPKSAANQRVKSKIFTKPAKTNTISKNAFMPQTLKLKPVPHNTNVSSDKVKHIRFDIPDAECEASKEIVNDIKSARDEVNNNQCENDYNSVAKRSSAVENIQRHGVTSVLDTSGNSELNEFEMLENCVENSSFSSDCSVVQKVLHKKTLNVQNHQKDLPLQSSKSSTESSEQSSKVFSIFPTKISFSKCREEARLAKQQLQEVISDINPRILSLQEEIGKSRKDMLEDSDLNERCSTPIDDLNVGSEVVVETSPENCSHLLASDIPEERTESVCEMGCQCCDPEEVLKEIYSKRKNIDQDDDLPNECGQNEEESALRKKRLELEKEIEKFQEENSKLSKMSKERNEIVKRLQKEREDFEKYKEDEKKKIQLEVEQERKQIKRQRETFMRFQKLNENPTRKEREELQMLRQEVEKLQDELKKCKIKSNTEIRRLKNRLIAAEKERDQLKLENIKLEDQCQDLLAGLKSHLKKQKHDMHLAESGESENKNVPVPVVAAVSEPMNSSPVHASATKTVSENLKNVKNKENNKGNQSFKSSKRPKTKVHFNLEPKHGNDELDNRETELVDQVDNEVMVPDQVTSEVTVPDQVDNEVIVPDQVDNEIIVPDQVDKEVIIPELLIESGYQVDNLLKLKHFENNHGTSLSVISVSAEEEFKEIQLENRIERIHASGEKEMIFSNGTRKIIGADGRLAKIFFPNGDVKEILEDTTEIYKYGSGVVETHYPDGTGVTEFLNGQVQTIHPDRRKEVKFPDGTIHIVFSDGSEEIRTCDGNIMNVHADGTETITFANGQKEIRTKTYKRREFPDGSVKIIFENGRKETRYADGRIRIKNKDGKIIVDTKYLTAS